MTRFRLAVYSLFLPVILWGVLLGGIVYSHIVYFPVYLSDLPASAIVINGKYGLDEAMFWGPLHPILITLLIAALAFNWKFPPRRKLLLTSLGIYIVVLIATFFYFLPELFAFKESAQSTVSPAEWLTRTNRWQTLSYIRGILMLIGFIPLLTALTKTNDSQTTFTQ